ncbi:MAG: diguanylate cyclase [Lachnospiraceae bacterium]|nr:diguanylate cyclase [Lachnospiraceae bacterium]
MKHILVVDDDSMNCVMAKHALSQNYRVTTAYSGAEALKALEDEVPDLILMDIEMPEMGGKEVVMQIKEKEQWASIPIIFLTADADPETEVECLKLGADDFITKPFVPMVMNGRIGRILELQDFHRGLEKELEHKTKQMEAATIKSLTDALTGLHNRDYLETKLKELLKAAHQGALFMIDLDNFKTINDTFGHIVGDKTLQLFADVLKKHGRENDIVCRLAGDEFVVFFTDLTDRDVAAKKAEGIITLFAEKMGALGYAGIVSVSIGIVFAGEGNDEFQTLYSKGDKSLYFVKNNGKNAYHFYSESKEKPDEINTVADLEYISRMMEEGMDISKGAFNVAYDEFKKIYDFVFRCVARKNQKVQIVLFTLRIDGGKVVGNAFDNAMQMLESSIISSLRAMDAGTRYSSSQYIVILMDTNIENGKMVAERVIGKFLESYGETDLNVNVTYNIQTMEPKL